MPDPAIKYVTTHCVKCGRTITANASTEDPVCIPCYQVRIIRELEENCRENGIGGG